MSPTSSNHSRNLSRSSSRDSWEHFRLEHDILLCWEGTPPVRPWRRSSRSSSTESWERFRLEQDILSSWEGTPPVTPWQRSSRSRQRSPNGARRSGESAFNSATGVIPHVPPSHSRSPSRLTHRSASIHSNTSQRSFAAEESSPLVQAPATVRHSRRRSSTSSTCSLRNIAASALAVVRGTVRPNSAPPTLPTTWPGFSSRSYAAFTSVGRQPRSDSSVQSAVQHPLHIAPRPIPREQSPAGSLPQNSQIPSQSRCQSGVRASPEASVPTTLSITDPVQAPSRRSTRLQYATDSVPIEGSSISAERGRQPGPSATALGKRPASSQKGRRRGRKRGGHPCPHEDCDRHQKPFTKNDDYHTHMAEEHKEYTLVCPHAECPRAKQGFTMQKHLESHIQVHQPQEERPKFPCSHENCSKHTNPFARKEGLKRHQQQVHHELGFQMLKCSTCKQTFSRRTAWNKHKSSRPDHVLAEGSS